MEAHLWATSVEVIILLTCGFLRATQVITLNAVFPPDRTIAGIPRCNQRWPPGKRKKGQFGPFLLQGCRFNTGIVF